MFDSTGVLATPICDFIAGVILLFSDIVTSPYILFMNLTYLCPRIIDKKDSKNK
jgi:hypothetical protein